MTEITVYARHIFYDLSSWLYTALHSTHNDVYPHATKYLTTAALSCNRSLGSYTLFPSGRQGAKILCNRQNTTTWTQSPISFLLRNFAKLCEDVHRKKLAREPRTPKNLSEIPPPDAESLLFVHYALIQFVSGNQIGGIFVNPGSTKLIGNEPPLNPLK